MNTIARIKLQNIISNYHTIQSQIPPDVKICVSVKANAYGHGLKEIASFLSTQTTIDYWGIASIEAALLIQSITKQGKVLCYTQLIENDLAQAISNEVELTVGDESYLTLIETIVKKLTTTHQPIKATIHLMIETGMGRLGFQPDEIEHIYERCQKSPLVEIIGICSHFSDSSDEHTLQNQLSHFQQSIQTLSPETHILLHIANSGGVIWNPKETSLHMVRPGIMLYGASPNPQKPLPPTMKLYAGMELIGHIGSIRRYEKGQTISYASTHICETACTIAIINTGYGDGLMRSMSNTGIVSIHNTPYPIVGIVCMDMCMVDMGNDTAKIGDEAVFFGNNTISIDEQAQNANTISYVLSTQITNRTKKIYQ